MSARRPACPRRPSVTFAMSSTAPRVRRPHPAPVPTFWQYLPFRDRIPERIQELLKTLSDSGTDPTMLALKATMTTQIAAWERDLFNPYLIGRMRIGAMQKYIAIRWMQHLILRADMLLRSDRPEPINEAVQLLVMAANLAGPKPSRYRRGPDARLTATTLEGKLDRFSNALVLRTSSPVTRRFRRPGPLRGADCSVCRKRCNSACRRTMLSTFPGTPSPTASSRSVTA